VTDAVEFDVVLRGYERGPVDALVGRTLAALGSASPAARAAALAELDQFVLRVVLRGYDRGQVDAFLRAMRAKLSS
jgi:DivIVA domain-containing protein